MEHFGLPRELLDRAPFVPLLQIVEQADPLPAVQQLEPPTAGREVGHWIDDLIREIKKATTPGGYRQLFMDCECGPMLARVLAALTVRIGDREASESKQYWRVFEAIRFLTRNVKQRRALLSRARIILAASNNTSIVDAAFDQAGLDKGEFVRLLEAVVEGKEPDLCRIRDIARLVAPRLSLSRGPKVSKPSAAYELLLTTAQHVLGRHPKARRSRIGAYTEIVAEATRRELNENFDPRPVQRRLKAKRAAETN